MANTYDQYDPIKIYTSTAFQDTATSTPFDPEEVYIEVKNPAGVTTTYQYGVDAELTKNSTGDYQLVLEETPHTAGWYEYYIYGQQADGTLRGADSGNFKVAAKNT